jgi:uncharacterized membrane protein YbhN (UPF0104 family)
MLSQQNTHRTSRLWNAIKLILALVLAGFVLSKTDFQELLALRNKILINWLVAVFLFYILLTILKSLQYYFLIGRRVGFFQVLNIVVVQNAISNFIATSAGIASYFALFRIEQGVKLSRATLAFILAKVGDLIAIWFFLAVACAAVWWQIEVFHPAVIFILLSIGLALLAFFVALIFRQKFVALLVVILDRLKLGKINFVSKGLSVLQALVEQEQSFVFRTIGMGVLFSFFYMLVTMAWLYAGLRTFSFVIGVMPTVFVNSLIQLISYLPIQIFGGLGLTETSMFYFYGPFNFPQNELAAILVATRLLFYLTNLVVMLYLPVHALFLNRNSR